MTMICPSCNATDISVLETRHDTDTVIRRRRQCDTCKLRFNTIEHVKQYAPGQPRRVTKLERILASL